MFEIEVEEVEVAGVWDLEKTEAVEDEKEKRGNGLVLMYGSEQTVTSSFLRGRHGRRP